MWTETRVLTYASSLMLPSAALSLVYCHPCALAVPWSRRRHVAAPMGRIVAYRAVPTGWSAKNCKLARGVQSSVEKDTRGSR